MRVRPLCLDEHVAHQAAEREIGVRLVQMTELTALESKLDSAESVRVDGYAGPAGNLLFDPRVDTVHLISFLAPQPFQLVLDWDGTVTVRDSQWMLLERFGDGAVFEAMEGALGTTHSYREVMELELATITAPFEEAVAFLLAEVRVRAGFRELVERFRPLVLSGGFVDTIAPILEREGVSVDLVANRLDPRPDGWRINWADDSLCPVCGDLCKRRLLPPGRPLVYVGDGYSDRCAALVADRVFTRPGLGRYLETQGVAHKPFETFDDIIRTLA
ncbi:MAG: haloacid dehalogenase-like hydrolase [Actinomycetes bacterium]